MLPMIDNTAAVIVTHDHKSGAEARKQADAYGLEFPPKPILTPDGLSKDRVSMTLCETNLGQPLAIVLYWKNGEPQIYGAWTDATDPNFARAAVIKHLKAEFA